MVKSIKITALLLAGLFMLVIPIQAKLMVTYDQKVAYLQKLDDDKIVSGDTVYIVTSDEVLGKAQNLVGQEVWILYYVFGEKTYAADVKMSTEPSYVIESRIAHESTEEGMK